MQACTYLRKQTQPLAIGRSQSRSVSRLFHMDLPLWFCSPTSARAPSAARRARRPTAATADDDDASSSSPPASQSSDAGDDSSSGSDDDGGDDATAASDQSTPAASQPSSGLKVQHRASVVDAAPARRTSGRVTPASRVTVKVEGVDAAVADLGALSMAQHTVGEACRA